MNEANIERLAIALAGACSDESFNRLDLKDEFEMEKIFDRKFCWTPFRYTTFGTVIL